MSTQVKPPVALQLYSIRELDMSYEEMLAATAAAGYGAVETVHKADLPAKEWRALLDRNGLQAICAHVPIQLMEESPEVAIETYAALGLDTIAIPAPGRKFWNEETTADDWKALGERLNGMGEKCRAAGLYLLYHNHAMEMKLYDGKRAIDLILGNADPANLGYEPDLAWIAHGGGDPVTLLQQYAGRCPRVHVKDLAPAGQNQDQMGLADVGHGTLDWNAILPAAKAAGAQWYIVEHDKPAQPTQSIARSYAYLVSVQGLL